MNLDKIGKFIAIRRKEKGITQEQLAKKLSISNRSVSKWERGLNLPDASLMIELCKILDISINELLTGKLIKKEAYEKQAEANLIKLKEKEERSNKLLLNMEVVIGLMSSFLFIILIFVASFINMDFIAQIILIIASIITFGVGSFFAMKLERTVGYYECRKCQYKYIPSVLSFWLSMHLGRTRYLKCPKCKKFSWSKKVLSK